MSFLLAIVYLLSHFLVYALWLRNRRPFSTERGIFFYHAVSLASITVALLLLMILPGSILHFPHVMLIVSVHAIYSMSFLELWALADGGYSLSILDCLDSNRELSEEQLLQELAKLGTLKKQDRITDLLRLGLIQIRDNKFSLTHAGRRFANMATVLIRIANVPDAR